MEFTLSKHAEDTMREREIDFAWLAATMDAPETTEQHPDDPTLIYAFRRIPEFGNRVLRVVYNLTKTPPHIVTFISTELQEANDEIRLRSPSGCTVHSA